MSLNLIMSTVFALVAICQCQKILNGKMQVSDGRSCVTLEDQENSYFKCHTSDSGKVCTLKCKSGFLVPITYTPPSGIMEVGKRGTYKCVSVIGGVNWQPDILFDCVERVAPKNLLLHFGVTIPGSCNSSMDMEAIKVNLTKDISMESDLMKTCEEKVEKGCSLKLYLDCINSNQEIDLEVAIPLTDNNADNFQEIKKKLNKTIQVDVKNFMTTEDQKGETTVTDAAFFSDCPYGTRLEGDLTCRGCSKGHYLDMSRMECAPCPKGTFQNRDLQASCEPCPEGAERDDLGLQNIAHCFDSGKWRQHTSVRTMLQAITCIVLVMTVILIFRSTVTNEPGPNTVEKELLDTDGAFSPTETVHRGSSLGSGDFSQSTDKALRKLTHASLPPDPHAFTAEGKRERRKERLRLTMDANMFRTSMKRRQSMAPPTRESRKIRKSMATALKLQSIKDSYAVVKDEEPQVVSSNVDSGRRQETTL